MARLNTRLSATPQHLTRASTVDSLYRDPSLPPRAAASNARTPSYSVLSPSLSISSDKENEQPETRESTPQLSKARGLRGGGEVARMPTPDSGPTPSGNPGKRRRTGDYDMQSSEIFQDEPEDSDDSDNAGSSAPAPDDEDSNLRFYNPNQDPSQRRQLRAHLRDNGRLLADNRDELLKPNSYLLDALRKQDTLFGKVRQTADAAIDSRFLVTASEIAERKLNASLQGNASVGIDLDQFISKAIYFMKSGGHVAGEADVLTIPVADDEDDDTGDGLDWAVFGRQACFPCNSRPPLSGFLLGPLSVQKRTRQSQRRARSQREPVGPATRPQELKEGDIQQSESSNLSALVKGINRELQAHLQRAEIGVTDELSQIPEDNQEDEDISAAFRRYRVSQTPDGEAAVGLLDFAIHPTDFGQTVENLFYISFLVREGNARVLKDDDGLPILMPAKPHPISIHNPSTTPTDLSTSAPTKNQAVFSIDYSTWRMFIDAFDIQEPLIPHREREEGRVGERGWYAG